MSDSRRVLLLSALSGALIVLGLTLVLPRYFKTTYSVSTSEVEKKDSNIKLASNVAPPDEKALHLPTPEPLKGIYMTACVAATPSWRASLKKLIETTELNAVVIDIKDATGVISFYDEGLQPSKKFERGCKISDLREFIKELHDSEIYVIGRISVFQDAYYTALRPDLAIKKLSDGGVWKDRKGLSFIDVSAKEYWDYIVRISKVSYELGFDELNFDYVRYPSDGEMKDVNYNLSASSSRQAVLESFFSNLSQELNDLGVKTSVDLFGMTTTVEVDMGIGQILERALPYFDYISPMVYPSHYIAGWNGFANPALYPYEVIKISMSRAVEREVSWNVSRGYASSTPSNLRPWLQDFHLGATYDAEKVRAQIQATYDSGLTSWILWSAANKYTEAALLPE